MLKFEDEFGKQSLLVFVIDGERMLWEKKKKRSQGHKAEEGQSLHLHRIGGKEYGISELRSQLVVLLSTFLDLAQSERCRIQNGVRDAIFSLLLG